MEDGGYVEQYLRDKSLVEKRYTESRLKWFFEEKSLD